MSIPSKEMPAFSEGGTSPSTTLLFALGFEAEKSGNEGELRTLAKDAAAHMKWVFTEKNEYSGVLLAKWEQHGLEVLKKWKTYRAMFELQMKLRAGNGLVHLILEEEQEPAMKREREDELIEEIEGLARLAKKLKDDRTEAK